MGNIQVLKRIKVVPIGKYASEEVATNYSLPIQWVIMVW